MVVTRLPPHPSSTHRCRHCHHAAQMKSVNWLCSRLLSRIHPDLSTKGDGRRTVAVCDCYDQCLTTWRTTARPRVVFLTAYQFSYTLDILFRSDSPQPSAAGLPRDWVHCYQSCAENLLTELTAHFLLQNSLQTHFAPPSLFLTKGFNQRFVFVRERHAYQQTVM